MGSQVATKAVQETVSQTLFTNPLLFNAPSLSSLGKVHTIVIGAGIGGMAAANELASKGKSVIVLEVNNYIGGRLKTIPVILSNNETFMFQEGANWIHGSTEQNPITKLSYKIKNLKMVETLDDSGIVFDEDGNEADKEVEQQGQEGEKLIEEIGQLENVEGLSIEEGIRQLNPQKLQNKYFMHNISNNMQFQTSGPISDLSAQHGQDDEQFEGKEMLICNGYQPFAQSLQHSNIQVLLNHKVSQVIYEKNKNVVKCSNGLSLQASNIVIAVPLGVLKSHNIRFTPNLPEEKEEAIRSIHFGNVCKILITLKGKKIDHKEHYIGVVENNVEMRGSATYFLNLTSVANIPAVMTFGLGANADELETMPQKALKELIAKRLRVFADKSFSVNDFNIVRTHWRTDPNFKGTYAYSGAQTKPHHWDDMAKPISKYSWYFCGEHTHSLYRGTVHGAYLSGIEAAKQILQQSGQQEEDKSKESHSSKKSKSQNSDKKQQEEQHQ